MADIKVRDLTDTSSVALDNQIMVLTNDAQNQVQNITVENLLTNVLSSDNGNVLEQGTDGKLYVETPENITGDLADLSTINKTSLVNAINEVDSDITDEATTRSNADNNLQSQIDAITSASDVTDIVGTYAQLQAYDTTGLPDNSIIKVLQDESRQNETTYYRWVITGGVGAWVLIGEEGPYYTKSQADSLFATRQTTGNLASLDTSDKTSLVNAINELSSVLDPTQTADYINNSKAVESGAISSNSIILSDVIKYAHSTFDLSKFTVVGSPVITDDGIASGFSSSNYATSTLPFTMNDNTKKYTFKGRIVIGNDITTDYQSIFNIGGTSFFFVLRRNSLRCLNSGGNYCSNGFTINANTTYDFILEYKIGIGGQLFVKEFSATSYTDTGLYSQTSWAGATNTNIRFGYGSNQQPFNGSLDLKQFSITVDGVEVFSGNKTGIDTIKPDDYTVVGTPTISADGVLTTSTNNYVLTPSFNITNAEDFELVSPFFNFETQSSVFQQGLNWADTIHTNDTWFFVQRRNSNGGLEVGIASQNTNVYARSVVTTDANTWYQIKFKYTYPNWFVYYRTKTTDWQQVNNSTITDTSKVTIQGTRPIAYKIQTNESLQYGQADLNGMQMWANGNLVYQPCLKIPYTKGSEQYGGKYVNAQYLPRVKDAYEQGLANDYFTLDEVNGTYTLPMGNLYGMIEKLIQLAKDEIGLPKATLSNTLNDNEIWLEGAEVSKLTYSKLYAIYGDDYGTPTDSANFVLPDCRDRVMQGIGSGGSFGYIEAGLPNITGNTGYGGNETGTMSGAFYSGGGSTVWGPNSYGHENHTAYFNASRSSSIYGNSTTVQPPAIKVRFKTRFQ